MLATYEFQAQDQFGKIIRDVVGATSKSEAIASIRGQGLNPIQVKEQGTTFNLRQLLARKPKQRLIMFRSLAELYETGLTPDQAFATITNQAKQVLAETERSTIKRYLPAKRGQEKFLRSIISLRHDIAENGVPLYTAMARRPNEFTAVEAAMVEAGADSGKLPQIFAEIARFLELDRKTNKQLRDALNYPAIVIIVAMCILAYILVGIIPKFAEFYKGFGVPIPGIMTAMLAVDGTLSNPLVDFAILGSIGLAGFSLVKWISTTNGALLFDSFRMKIPLLGQFFSKAIMVRICRVLAMLSRAGKTNSEVLKIAAPVVGSPVFAMKLRKVEQLLSDGEVANLHEAFDRTNEFDAMLIGLMGVGVETGDYASPLEKMAEFYEQDVESIASALPALLQSIVTLVIGIVVFFVAAAVYLPLSNLSANIH
jgi:type II secretory pathway component PulF